MASHVTIILLNWNNKEDTLDCIRSLKLIDYVPYSIIVADNGSSDDSVESIRTSFPDITVLENGANLGFAAGNNAGIKLALQSNPEYVLLLNNDTVVDPEFLSRLVAVAESDPKIGITGPKIFYHSDPERIWFAGGIVDWRTGKTRHTGDGEIDAGKYNQVADVDFITGCALLIKSTVLREIGLLDDVMGFYYEDNDLCERARKAGYRIVYAPEAKVWHKIARSASKIKDFQLYYFTRNRLRFMRKHAGTLRLALFLPYYIITFVLVKLAIALGQLKWSQARLILKAFYEGMTR